MGHKNVSRPYFKKSGKELEEIFSAGGDDSETLQNLLDELKHRTTPKAIALRRKVEACLSSAGNEKDGDQESSSTPTQQNMFPLATSAATEKKKTSTIKDQPSSTQQDDSVEGIFQKPEIFKLVEPRGVKGRPEKRVFDLKKDVQLDLGDNDPVVKKYRAALKLLIGEMRRKGAGSQDLSLENGEKVALDGKGVGYAFPFTEEGNIFEGASVQFIIGGNRSDGQIVSIMGGKIIISIDDDYGPVIHTCILRIDNTSLLDALEKRLGQIEEGEISHFNKEMAENVVFNKGAYQPPAPQLSSESFKKLDVQKQKAVCRALTNPVIYIWGPPGSGKTTCIGFLIHEFYESDKRILICSNTNQAVDQVILKLCREFQNSGNMEALEDGAIIRTGKITHAELEHDFSPYVTVQGVVERKSEELIQRRDEINGELERIARAAASTERILQQFSQYDGLLKAILNHNQTAENASTDLKSRIREIRAAQEKLQKVEVEYKKFQEAGAIRRVLMRSEQAILQDKAETIARQKRLSTEKAAYEERIKELCTEADELKSAKQQMETALSGHDRRALEVKAKEFDEKRQPLQSELNEINRKLEDIQRTVMEQAKIVGATVTKTYLSPNDFSSFDIVIIDEASMIPIPMLYYAAGLAKEKCIVSGDFRQLAPIIQTEQKAIHEAIGRDVFSTAGIVELVRKAHGTLPEGRVIMLDEQFRMDEQICKLITGNFYEGQLKTAPGREPLDHPHPPAPYNGNLTIIDTSRVWPFSNRDPFKSRYNLMHALAVRNLCLHLHENGFVTGKGSLGICTPYAAQAKIHRKIMEGYGLKDIEAGTVHRYQGDEKAMMIIDIPDSIGDYGVGQFLQANNLEDGGAKLFNVAVSRAKEHLVVFANLTYLDDKLPGDAFLRDILFQMQKRGNVVDVQDVIALRPIYQDLEHLRHSVNVDLKENKNGLFDQREFESVCMADLAQAQKSIAIFSGFITPQRVAPYSNLFREKINNGVAIRCVTRPPASNGSIPEEDGRKALQALESMGVVIDLRQGIHEKVVLIDDQIAWFGSLNPLSHTSHTDEMMARLENPDTTLQIASFLTLNRSAPADVEGGKVTAKENPACPDCGAWTVYKSGRYGPYFECEQRCGWKESLDKSKKQKNTPKQIDLSGYDVPATPPACPKDGCGAAMQIRMGRYGPFYGCSAYPKCNGIVNLKKRRP